MGEQFEFNFKSFIFFSCIVIAYFIFADISLIVGVVIGSLAALVVIAGGVFYYQNRRKNSKLL